MSLQISMLLKNLIKDISKDKKNIKISGLSLNSKKVKRSYFLLLKEIKLMVKNLLMRQFRMAPQLLFVIKVTKLKTKTYSL